MSDRITYRWTTNGAACSIATRRRCLRRTSRPHVRLLRRGIRQKLKKKKKAARNKNNDDETDSGTQVRNNTGHIS